jgi:hypothetical protein
MAQSNFQDVVQLNQATLSVLGEQIQIGSDAGSKSIVFAQDPAAASAIHLAASNATGAETVIIPDANGTIGLITNISAGTTLLSNGAAVFSNSNGLSFGVNGNTVTATADYVRSISAGTTNATGNQIVFSNSNGVSFGANGATITASVAAGATVVSGIGVSTGGNTSGNTGTTNGTIVLAGIGNITLSQSTAGGNLATISISGSQSTGPGAIAAGTQTATSGTVVFVNSNDISFGMSGSSQITASFGGNLITAFSQWAEFNTNNTISNASLSIQKFSMPMSLSCTELAVLMALTGATNSSGALTISVGVYTLNHSTASLASSATRQISWTSGSATSASSQYGGASGTLYRTIGANFAMPPGDYLMVFLMSTTNNGTWRAFGRDGANIVGLYDGVESKYWLDGTSISSTASLPGSIVVTDTGYARTGLGALRQPGFIAIGTY